MLWTYGFHLEASNFASGRRNVVSASPCGHPVRRNVRVLRGGGEVHCSPRPCRVFQVRRVAVAHSRCVARAVWHRPRDGPQHRAHRGWAGLSAVDGLATDCASSAVSVEPRWRVAGRPTPTARRGLPRRRGRTPAASRFIKCVRGAPARDPPAARVAHSAGAPVGHGVLHRRRGARRGLCEGRRRGRIGRRNGDQKMIQKGTYGSSVRLRRYHQVQVIVATLLSG